MILFKFFIREFRNNKKYSLFFLLNLILGLSSFAVLESVKTSFAVYFNENSKSILTADISVSGRREIKEEELIEIKDDLSIAEKSQLTSMFSMLSANKLSRLVQIRAIDDNYPLYGKIKLKSQGDILSNSLKDIFKSDNVWVYPDLLVQFQLKIGDKIKIGEKEFNITDVVEEDPGVNFSAAMAPRVYMSPQSLEATKLLQFGSTAFYINYFKFPKNTDIKKIEQKWNLKIEDPALRIQAYDSAGEQVGRIQAYLNDYLGLVSLVALFLSCLGAVFLYRSYLERQRKTVAILRSLGVGNKVLKRIYILQLVLLSLISTIMAFVISIIILPYFFKLYDSLGIKVEMKIMGLKEFAYLLFISLSCSLSACYPVLLKYLKVKANDLFQDEGSFNQFLSWKLKDFFYYLPAILLFWYFATVLSNSYIVGTVFSLIFAVSILLFSIFYWLVIIKIPYEKLFSSSLAKSIFRNIKRKPIASFSLFLALSIASSLMNIIPQIQNNIRHELEFGNSKIPDLFFFDIQEEQVSEFKDFMSKKDFPLKSVSPMVRARLITVNGEKFEKNQDRKNDITREQQAESRFRNRGFNLSYRDILDESEEIIEGESIQYPYNESKQAYPYLSLEYRFADRLGLKLGDILKFDVQGVEVEGLVKNLRRIRWTSFQPNFFIQFQSGVLEMAPKTYLATVGGMDFDERNWIQLDVVKAFSNISIIDITKLIQRIMGLVESMSYVLIFMAFISIMAALAVIFSITSYQVSVRKKDVALLKMIGAPFRWIFYQFNLEFIFIALLASSIGMVLGLITSYVISVLIFEGVWAWNLIIPISNLILILVLASLVSILSVRRYLKLKVNQLLH